MTMETPCKLFCQVDTVIDGDTITCNACGMRYVIRLAHIDAPEINEAYYRESRQFLLELIHAESVHCHCSHKDMYGRYVAEIITEDVYNINAEMLSNGWAFHFKKYSDSAYYAQKEREARDARLGLWSDPIHYTYWCEKQKTGEKKIYERGHYKKKSKAILSFVLEWDEMNYIPQSEFEAFEKRTREAMEKRIGCEIRQITQLLEHSEKKIFQ